MPKYERMSRSVYARAIFAAWPCDAHASLNERMSGDGDDRVRSTLELNVDVGSTPPIGVSALVRRRHLALSTFGHPTIENDLHSRVRREAFPKVVIKVRIAARDNEDRTSHSLLFSVGGRLPAETLAQRIRARGMTAQRMPGPQTCRSLEVSECRGATM